jgi:cell division protein FtsI/penicillin-binding protein 2
VIDAAVAARLSQAMRAVAQLGTAAGFAPPGLEVAMKTGTASAPRIGYHVNYVGFAPAAEPSLAFCVRVTGRRSSQLVHEDAREVTGRLLAALRDRLASARTPSRVDCPSCP